MTYIERLSLEFCPKVIKYFLTKQTFTKKPPSRPLPLSPSHPASPLFYRGREAGATPGELPLYTPYPSHTRGRYR